MLKIVKNGQKWSKMVKNGPNRVTIYTKISYVSETEIKKLKKNVKTGQKWSKMVKNGQNGPK